MKSILTIITLLTLLTSCSTVTNLPDILKEEQNTLTSNKIEIRDQVDATLITTKPQIQYFKKGNEYTFLCLYPQINKSDKTGYQWNTKWTYLLKKKDGLLSQTGKSQITITPIDFLSVQVEVYCINSATGIKSYPYSNGLVIDLTKSKTGINTKK